MSRKAPAVQLYAEDFLGGTKFMSNAEVGLYIRLLCEQVDKGFIADDVELFVKAFGKECRKLWPTVRTKFVDGPKPGTIINERMAKAIAARDAYRLKQSEKGKLSASIRSTTNQPWFNRGSTVVEPLGDGDGVKKISGKERATPEGFAEFWAVYPEHKARAAAEKVWAKLKPEEAALCKPAIEAQVAAKHFTGKDGNDYVPHGSTWLNQRRWEDEVKLNVAPPVSNKPLTREQGRAMLDEIRRANGIPPGGGIPPELLTGELRQMFMQ